MLFWSIKVIILSLALIFLVHYLINFLTSTLTVPKVKDLVNAPTQKYENIFNIIKNEKHSSENNTYTNNKKNKQNIQNKYTNGTDINLLPQIDTNNTGNDSNTMKNELKGFLKKQLNEDNNNNNNNNNHVHFMESSTVNSYSSL